MRCLADYLVEKLVYGMEEGTQDVYTQVNDIREVNRYQFKLQNIIELASNTYKTQLSVEEDAELF